MSISVRWKCGHVTPIKGDARPKACSLCGDIRRLSVIAPPPRFVGTVRGPHAEFKALDPIATPFEGAK